MLPRSAYWHHITGSQNMAESSSYAGECPHPTPRRCCSSSPQSFHHQVSPASVLSPGEAYAGAQASSDTDLLNRFILLKPKSSKSDKPEDREPTSSP